MTATTIYKTPEGRTKIHKGYDQILAQWSHKFEQIFVDTNEGKTFVIASGPLEAPPLVLLHGSLSNALTWLGDALLWAKQYRVYAVDIIGEAGKSAEARPTLNSQAYSAWLTQVFTALNVDRPTLIGLSLGGWLALDFATTYPDRISGLVLLSPGGIGPNRNILRWALPYFFLGRWGVRKVFSKILGPVAAQQNIEESEIGKLLLDISSHVRPRTEALPVFSDEQLSKIKSPVLLIIGGKDVTLYPTLVKERLERLVPVLTVKLMAEAGHYLGDQSRDILDFLESMQQPPSRSW